MLADLEDIVYDEIAAAFRLRLINHVSEDGDKCWDEHIVSLIKKRPNAILVKHFRGVAI